MAKEMDVTARVFPSDEFGPNLLGFASITLASCFVINNLRVMNGKDGPFIAMPSKKIADGEYQDTAFPVTTEMREKIDTTVMEEYFRQTSFSKEERGYTPAPAPDPTTTERMGARLSLTPDSGNQLATAKVTIGGCFVVEGIRVMNSDNGPFVAMPSRMDSYGEFRDIAFPITAQMREDLNAKVMDKYQEALLTAQRKAERSAQKEAEQSQEGKAVQDRKESHQEEKSGQGKSSMASTIEDAKREAQAREAARQQGEQRPPSHSTPTQEAH